MFPWKPKHIQNLCFDINFHFSCWALLSVVKLFSLTKFSQWMVFFTRARNRGKYGGTTFSGRIPTKWCNRLSKRKFRFFVSFQSLEKIFKKLTQSLTMCWCLMILWPKQQIVLSFPFCLPKASIEILVWYCCYEICFQRENLTQTSAGNAQYLALFRSPSDRKQIGIVAEQMFDKNRPRFMSAYFQETERAFDYIFVDNCPDTPSDKQVLSDIFGFCCRYLTINSSAKSNETVIMTSYNENIACEARSAVKSPPVVKSSLLLAKTSWPFRFYSVWSEAAYPIVQNYMHGAPRCQTLPKDFRNTEIYCIARHLYDPYLPLYFHRIEITGLWK